MIYVAKGTIGDDHSPSKHSLSFSKYLGKAGGAKLIFRSIFQVFLCPNSVFGT